MKDTTKAAIIGYCLGAANKNSTASTPQSSNPQISPRVHRAYLKDIFKGGIAAFFIALIITTIFTITGNTAIDGIVMGFLRVWGAVGGMIFIFTVLVWLFGDCE